jgi:hypothetical protein
VRMWLTPSSSNDRTCGLEPRLIIMLGHAAPGAHAVRSPGGPNR